MFFQMEHGPDRTGKNETHGGGDDPDRQKQNPDPDHIGPEHPCTKVPGRAKKTPAILGLKVKHMFDK